jgi:hypothetical protein
MIQLMKNKLPVFKNKELNQFALYCEERFGLVDKQLDTLRETTAAILEKITHIEDVFGKTRSDVVDLQYRVTKLEQK